MEFESYNNKSTIKDYKHNYLIHEFGYQLLFHIICISCRFEHLTHNATFAIDKPTKQETVTLNN